MTISEIQQKQLKQLPGVDQVLTLAEGEPAFAGVPKSVLTPGIRMAIDELRAKILSGDATFSGSEMPEKIIIEDLKSKVSKAMTLNLRRTVNAAGVVVHTNLGRSLLAGDAIDNIREISTKYSNLEFNLATGKRGLRYSAVEDIICEISGAEAAMVVNNNAAAVLLCLDTIARGREVIVSRGELVEIGGSFRIPDVMTKSGCILKEVGTTNRTHLKDYRNGISEETAMFLKVHTSNFSIVGFTSSVPLKEMVELGRRHNITVMDDLGSGTFIDFSKYGMIKEPTVQDSVSSGADVVTFSGDKLLGGPQAGIIVGRREIIEEIRQNPLTRALRIDKMTLAGLEATLRLYRDEEKAVKRIPTLRMLTTSFEEICLKAEDLAGRIKKQNIAGLEATLIRRSSKAGGGALPLMKLPTMCVGITIKGKSANWIEKYMRNYSPPIIGRIVDDIFLMDPRTLQDDELSIIETAVAAIE